MAILTIVVLGVLTLLLYMLHRLRGSRGSLEHVPGPKQYPFIGNVLQLKPGYARLTLQKWAKEFGPVYRAKILRDEFLVLSDYEHLNEVLVKQSANFTGRPYMFRFYYLFDDTGTNQMEPSPSWKFQRQLGQKALKQFGEGMRRIEEVHTRLLEEMLDRFQESGERPFDPKDVIYETTLKSITTFILGKQVETTDLLFQILRKFERGTTRMCSALPQYVMLDYLPFLLHLPLGSGADVRNTIRLKYEAWDEIKRRVQHHPPDSSFAKVLIDTAENGGGGAETDSETGSKVQLTETDARMLCLSMVNAGHATTSSAFHALLNILAHRPAVQDRIWGEVAAVGPREGFVESGAKSELPYAQATLLELLRYFTVAPQGLPRRATVDSVVQGLSIPKDVSILNNFWALHHDKDFWGDPEMFRPERFLNTEGQMLPADHDNRKHVMTFSAGVRVCPGEQFAMNRLFLWMFNICARFTLLPAPGNLSSFTEADVFHEDLLLRSRDYEIIFQAR